MANDAISGGLAALSSCILLQPLEVYKTRLQEQSKLPSQLSHYWRGTTVTLVRNVPGVAIYFTILQQLRYMSIVADRRFGLDGLLVDKHTTTTANKLSTVGHLVTGGGARVLAGLLLMPVTVIKTMFESDRYESVGGMRRMIAMVYQRDGLKGLFKGASVTILRDAPHTAIYVACYEHLKTMLTGYRHHSGQTIQCMMAGLGAGAFATILTQPFDSVKTAIQLNKYDSVGKAITGMFKEANNPSAFYRGTMPRFMRKTASSAITWTLYEYLAGR